MSNFNNTEIIKSCYARVGLLGNPSDGFHGQTLSTLLSNFQATAILKPRNDHRVVITESVHFDNTHDLPSKTARMGYESGLRLQIATAKKFFELAHTHGKDVSKGFELTFETNIPRMVGLSGSSAIVVSTLRALCSYFDIKVTDLGLVLEQLPSFVLNVEKEELGIAAGLQDRVIQTYGGLVHMDFTHTKSENDIFTRIDPTILPHMYIVYNCHTGGDSGKVHSTVKERWAKQDPQLVSGMKELGENTARGVQALQEKNYAEFANLMERNFTLRREMYSDAIVGATNIEIANILSASGFASKFCGSGGAFICLHKERLDWLGEDEEMELSAKLAPHFKLVRAELGSTVESWNV